MGDMHPNAQQVLRGFQAFAEGDMVAMKELFDDDSIWHFPGRNKWSGDYQGVDSILRFFGEVTAEATIEQDLHAILADDEHVVALVHSKATRGDIALESQQVFIFHISDGKVGEVWAMAGDDYAIDEFWA